jgi:hypothetical protein
MGHLRVGGQRENLVDRHVAPLPSEKIASVI